MIDFAKIHADVAKKNEEKRKLEHFEEMVNNSDKFLNIFLQDFISSCEKGKEYFDLRDNYSISECYLFKEYLEYRNIKVSDRYDGKKYYCIKLNYKNIRRIQKVFKKEIEREMKINDEIRNISKN